MVASSTTRFDIQRGHDARPDRCDVRPHQLLPRDAPGRAACRPHADSRPPTARNGESPRHAGDDRWPAAHLGRHRNRIAAIVLQQRRKPVMPSNVTETSFGHTAPPPAPVAIDVRLLTAGQLRMLGLTQVAYLTASMLDGEPVAYTIRGADGIVVATFEELGLALELLNRRGMALVPVH